MEILEFLQGGSKILVNALKTVFSHEASLKNCSRKTAIFAYFIFSKILKIELSPPRELDFGCFENCFGPFFRVPKILKIAVLRACQHSFSNVHALNLKICFFSVFMKNVVFSMFFNSFGPPGGVPGPPWTHPWRQACIQLVRGSSGGPKSTQNGPPRAPKLTPCGKDQGAKNSVFAWNIIEKLQSRNCNIRLLHFFENIEN